MSMFEADVDAFLDWWRTGGTKTRRDSTAREYLVHVRGWYEWESRRISNPSSTPTIRSVRAYLAEKRHSDWTAFMAVRALKAWSRFLTEDLPLPEDPLAKLPYRREPETSRTPVASLEDIDALLVTCSADSLEDARDRTIICLLRATGMRRGELIELRWDDIDLREATVRLRPETVKNGKGRTVGFDGETRRALRTYIQRLDRHELENQKDLHSWHPYVWVSRQGRLTGNGLAQSIRRRARRAGVDVTIHSFRRSLAVRWLRSGESQIYLSQTVGWESERMAGRYVSSVKAEEAHRVHRALLETESSDRGQRKHASHTPRTRDGSASAR